MKVSQPSAPAKCCLCLRNTDDAIAHHLRLQKPCTQPGCPLHDVINKALYSPATRVKPLRRPIVFGKPTKKMTFPSPAPHPQGKYRMFTDYIIRKFKSWL